jgi:hypothetical protein
MSNLDYWELFYFTEEEDGVYENDENDGVEEEEEKEEEYLRVKFSTFCF